MRRTFEQWREVGKELTDSLLDGEQAVVIYLEGVAPTVDCELPTVTVGIRGTVCGPSAEEFTGNATDLDSACRIARWKLQERRKAVLKEREKAKTGAA